VRVHDFRLPRKKGALKPRLYRHLGWLVIGAIPVISGLLLVQSLQQSHWDGRTRITVVSTTPTELISYDPNEDQVTLITFPDNLVTEFIQGLGVYPVAKGYQLDFQEKRSDQLLLATLTQSFGVYTADVFHTEKMSSPGRFWFSGRLKFLQNQLTGALVTRMPLVDRWRWFWSVGKASPTTTTLVDLSQAGFLEEQTAVDGTVYRTLNTDKWDAWVRRNLTDAAVERERLAIAVVNHTDSQGLGALASRIIANTGGQVTRVRNDTTPLSRCLVRTIGADRNSVTVTLLLRVFPCSLTIGDLTDERADIALHLGDDYRQFIRGGE
jgi:hypothetical protein